MSEISSFSGDNHFLSNFHPSSVMMDGCQYPTVEHAYQAAKTIDPEEREIIRSAPTPGMAKKLGKHANIRPDWDEIKVSVMGELLWQKFNDHPDLRTRLLGTGHASLVEGNWWGDTFWGVCRGTGKNWLGRLLMEIRHTLLEQEKYHEHSAA